MKKYFVTKIETTTYAIDVENEAEGEEWAVCSIGTDTWTAWERVDKTVGHYPSGCFDIPQKDMQPIEPKDIQELDGWITSLKTAKKSLTEAKKVLDEIKCDVTALPFS